LSSCLLRLLPGTVAQYDAAAVDEVIRPKDSHFAQSRLVVVENTHNRGGGTCWSLDAVEQIKKVADKHGLNMHLDGARMMNACVAKGHKPADYAKFFDTVSMCFSKGLGAPVGSAVAGSSEMIHRVHRFRKMFGGGMRQAGVIAAAAIYALDHNVERLAEDHQNAKRLAQALATMDHVGIDMGTVETNIVYFDIDPAFGTAQQVCDRLQEAGVLMIAVSPQRVRAVTHLDVSTTAMDKAIDVVKQVFSTALC